MPTIVFPSPKAEPENQHRPSSSPPNSRPRARLSRSSTRTRTSPYPDGPSARASPTNLTVLDDTPRRRSPDHRAGGHAPAFVIVDLEGTASPDRLRHSRADLSSSRRRASPTRRRGGRSGRPAGRQHEGIPIAIRRDPLHPHERRRPAAHPQHHRGRIHRPACACSNANDERAAFRAIFPSAAPCPTLTRPGW